MININILYNNNMSNQGRQNFGFDILNILLQSTASGHNGQHGELAQNLVDRDKEKLQGKSDNQPKEAGNNARDKVRNPKCAIQAHVQHLQAYVSKCLSIDTHDDFITAKPFSFFVLQKLGV